MFFGVVVWWCLTSGYRVLGTVWVVVVEWWAGASLSSSAGRRGGQKFSGQEEPRPVGAEGLDNKGRWLVWLDATATTTVQTGRDGEGASGIVSPTSVSVAH
jgi:hypothetical protein